MSCSVFSHCCSSLPHLSCLLPVKRHQLQRIGRQTLQSDVLGQTVHSPMALDKIFILYLNNGDKISSCLIFIMRIKLASIFKELHTLFDMFDMQYSGEVPEYSWLNES